MQQAIDAEASQATFLDRLVTALAGSTAGEERALLLEAVATSEPTAVLEHLRAEFARQRQTDAALAARLADCVVVGAQASRQPRYEALGRMARADMHWLVGRYAEAVQEYELARETFSALGDAVGWARTHVGWVIACHYLGRGESALASLAEARAVLLQHHEWSRAVNADLNAGYVLWRLGRCREAVERYQAAERILLSMAAPDRRQVAWVRGNQAIALTLLGDLRAARLLHEEARATFAEVGETASLLRTEYFLAELLAADSDLTEALRRFAGARDGFVAAGLPVDAAWVDLSMAETALELNRPTLALARCEAAEALFTGAGSAVEVARCRVLAARALGRLGDQARAVDRLVSAQETFRLVGDEVALAAIALESANVALAGEAWQQGATAADEAVATFQRRGLVQRWTDALVVSATAWLRQGDLRQAADRARQVLRLEDDGRVVTRAAAAQAVLAAVARQSGHRQRALRHARLAVVAVERMHARLATDWRGHYLADKETVYREAIEAALLNERPAEALDFVERYKWRALLDHIAATGQPAPGADADAPLVAELTRLRQEHSWLYRRRYESAWSVRAEAGADEAADHQALDEALARHEQAILVVTERLSLRHRASPRRRRHAGASTLPQRLTPDTTAIEYHLADDVGLAFVATNEGIQVVPLATTGLAVRQQIRLWHLNLEAVERSLASGRSLAPLVANARAVLGALYRQLLAPLAKQYEGRQRLVIVPAAAMHGLPFAALGDGTDWLVDRHELVTQPASDLIGRPPAAPRGGQRRGATILAHGQGGRLAAVAAEARAIGQLVPHSRILCDDEATRTQVRALAPTSRILHLATHGALRPDEPSLSHIDLADGPLTADEALGLDVRGALVVLSACETGRGMPTGGDEVIGLARSFLYAGAAVLVQSLWRIDDEGAAALMQHFYAQLAAGATPAAALRLAQRARRAESAHGHPFDWAGFEVVGDGWRPGTYWVGYGEDRPAAAWQPTRSG